MMTGSGIIDSEFENVYAFGIRILIMRVICTLSMLTIGMFYGKIVMIFFFYIGFIALRSFYPGYHAPNRIICFIFSSLLVFVCISLSDAIIPLLKIYLNIIFIAICFSIQLIQLFKIFTIEKRKADKNILYKITLSLIIISLLYILINWGFMDQAYGLFMSIAFTFILHFLKKIQDRITNQLRHS